MANGLATVASFRDVLDAQAAMSKLGGSRERSLVALRGGAGDLHRDSDSVLAHSHEMSGVRKAVQTR